MAKQREGLLLPLHKRDGTAPAMSDEALVAAIAIGERTALGALFDRHQAAVFRFVSRTISTNASDVEDLVQCTFVEAWRSAKRFRHQGRVLSWLFGIAANLSRHFLRTQARRQVAMKHLADIPPPTSARPDEDAETNELIGRLGLALGELPHHLRVAFVLCDLEQIPGVEASRVLGVREGTMWRRIHQARKALREALGGRST